MMGRHATLHSRRARLALYSALSAVAVAAVGVLAPSSSARVSAATVRTVQATGCFAAITTYQKTLPAGGGFSSGNINLTFGALGITSLMDGATSTVSGVNGDEPTPATCLTGQTFPATTSSTNFQYSNGDGTTTTCTVSTDPAAGGPPTITIGPATAPAYSAGGATLIPASTVNAGAGKIEGLLLCTNTTSGIGSFLSFIAPMPMAATPTATATPPNATSTPAATSTPSTPPPPPGTATPELPSGELLAAGILPILGLLYLARRRAGRGNGIG